LKLKFQKNLKPLIYKKRKSKIYNILIKKPSSDIGGLFYAPGIMG